MIYLNNKLTVFKIADKEIQPDVQGLSFFSVEFFDEIGIYVFQLEPHHPHCPQNSVFGYNKNGEKVWTVSQPVLLPENFIDAFSFAGEPSYNLEKYEIYIHHMSGNRLILDCRNGKTRFADPKTAFFFFSKKANFSKDTYPRKRVYIDNKYVAILHKRDQWDIGPCNVFAYNEDGELAWQIDWPWDVPYARGDAFSNIWIKDNKLHGYLGSGHSVEIDPATGKTSNTLFTK